FFLGEHAIRHVRLSRGLFALYKIETKDLLRYVQEQNVNYGSGFYFARALDIPAFIKYIEDELWKAKLD
ncbi:MAG: hypothetical protein K2H06_04885, partial [Anaeroplasmataceae bacterium]|nr:hypothetical protein [Anaeroplasmataceae bacterium]